MHITNETPDALGYKGVSNTVNKSIYLNRHNYNAVKKRKTAPVHQQDAQIVCNSTIGLKF